MINTELQTELPQVNQNNQNNKEGHKERLHLILYIWLLHFFDQ